MEYRKLSLTDTDMPVSRVGFGCWAIGGYGWGRVDDGESMRAIRAALDLGINLFDTADVYGFGHSEEVLSRALGDDRERVVVATKFGVSWDASGTTGRDISPRSLVRALEASLRRLRLDAIPLYQIHWPDDTTPIADTMEALVRCKQAGKIRGIGCCNFSAELLGQAAEFGPIVSIQVPYNVLDRRAETAIFAECRELGIGTLAYSPLGQGVLSAKYDGGTRFDKRDVRSRSVYFRASEFGRNLKVAERLGEVGARYGKTPAQVAIRWVLDNTDVACALAGMKTASQVVENAEIDWRLSAEDRELIRDAGARV